jgi:hypothetical protein
MMGENTYRPHGQHYMASLYVALKEQGLELDTLDFCLEGSTLEILVTQKMPNDENHLVALLPGSSMYTVMVAKHKKCAQDCAIFGFQFKRLVFGKLIICLHDPRTTIWST